MIEFMFAGILATFLAYISQFEQKGRSLFLALFVIWFIASFQDAVGIDFASYEKGFFQILDGRRSGSFFRTDRSQIEIGWFVLCKGIGTFVNTFYAVTPIVYAFILYALYRLLLLVPKQWRWLFIFYYYFGIKYFLFDMSGIRQGIAIACWILLALALKDKKYKTAIIFVLLGISFHNSFIYSLLLIPLTFIPYERITFNKHKLLWTFLVLGSFAAIYVYLSLIYENIMVFSLLFEGQENEEVYLSYITEMEEHRISWISLLLNVILLLFVTVAFTNQMPSTPYSNMFYVLYIFTFIVDSALGGFGSLPRIFLYTGFFALPAIAITGFHLKGFWRMAFLVYIIFITLFSFYAKIHTEQYLGYLNYHTIFF